MSEGDAVEPKYEIRIFWSDEDDAYVAVVTDLPYLSAWGESYQEALEEALVAIRGYLKVAEKYGDVVPEPGTRTGELESIESVEERGRPVNAAAAHLAEAVRESYQTVADRAVSAQPLNAELTQNFFNSVINNLRSQAESNRQITQQERQAEGEREKTQASTQESVDTYMDFVNSMFSFYQGTVEQAQRRTPH